MAEGKAGETLISFRSGHYKKVIGKWKGDSVWCHFVKDAGGMVHVNKEEVEYMETFADGIPSELKEPLEKARMDPLNPAKALQDRKRYTYADEVPVRHSGMETKAAGSRE